MSRFQCNALPVLAAAGLALLPVASHASRVDDSTFAQGQLLARTMPKKSGPLICIDVTPTIGLPKCGPTVVARDSDATKDNAPGGARSRGDTGDPRGTRELIEALMGLETAITARQLPRIAG
jgi:hypothetical protein